MFVTRRSVLAAGIAAAAGVPRLALAAPRPAAFIGQSGEPQSGRLVLGMLLTRDEVALRAAVSALRRDTSYRRVLRSRSTDKYKAAFARALLDELSRRADTSFSAVEFALPAWPRDAADRSLLVLSAMAEATAGLPDDTPLTLVDNGDGTNIGAMVRAAAPMRSIRYGLIAQDDLLQVAAFLTGLANPAGARTRSKKAALLAHLQVTLAVPEVSTRALSAHPRFALRAVRLP